MQYIMLIIGLIGIVASCITVATCVKARDIDDLFVPIKVTLITFLIVTFWESIQLFFQGLMGGLIYDNDKSRKS